MQVIAREILREWLKGKGKKVTWSELADGLELIDLVDAAGAVREIHCRNI